MVSSAGCSPMEASLSVDSLTDSLRALSLRVFMDGLPETDLGFLLFLAALRVFALPFAFYFWSFSFFISSICLAWSSQIFCILRI